MKRKNPRPSYDRSELVFRLVRRGEATYWSGPHNPREITSTDPIWFPKNPDEEVRHLSVADAFDAARKDGE